MKLNDSNLFRQQALINGSGWTPTMAKSSRSLIRQTATSWVAYPKWALMKPAPLSTPPTAPCPRRALTAKERANILRNWFNLMMEHQDDLARLMTLEQGKPLAEAKGEISYAASLLSGLPKKANVFMAIPFPVIRPTNA